MNAFNEKIKPINYYVLGSILGLTLNFLIVFLFGSSKNIFFSLLISSVGGFFGLFVTVAISQGGNVLPGYSLAILLAYIFRLFFGIAIYLILDPNYFEGDGDYKWGHSELELSYYAARVVFDYMSGNDSSLPNELSEVLNSGISKNPIIHWWMGIYLYTIGSDYSMNLMPFNAMHNCLAGIGITALARYYGYRYEVSCRAGIITAWLPWGFPASLLWRDTIGLFFVVFSINLLLISVWKYKKNIFYAVPAIILLFAHRTIYPVVGISFIIWELFLKIRHYVSSKLVIIIILLLTPIVVYIFQDSFLMYYDSEEGALGVVKKMIVFPLLIVRSIFGTFPWWQDFPDYILLEKIWDYIYNVIQLAVFIIVAINWRIYLNNFNGMHVVFSALYFLALIAPGLHTSYLAMCLPFILPFAISVENKFFKYVALSFIIFIMTNLLYYLVGFQGKGYIMNTTGY